MKAELILDAKALLGEGPSWDAGRQLLYWVDIMNHQVHIYSPDHNTDQTITVEPFVSVVVPREKGGLVLAKQDGFFLLDTATGKLTPITDPEPRLPDTRFNDGKCDAAGRLWAGTMSLIGKSAQGELYRLGADLQAERVLDDISISNGIAWSPDQQTMYYIDTPTREVVAYDYDEKQGRISGKRTVIRMPAGEFYPDGMTSDEEGMLWIAEWNGGKVARWNPATGECLESVEIPAPLVTSCVFAGEEMDELYVTTARSGLTEEQLEKFPFAGGLFRVRTKVKGAPTYFFKG